LGEDKFSFIFLGGISLVGCNWRKINAYKFAFVKLKRKADGGIVCASRRRIRKGMLENWLLMCELNRVVIITIIIITAVQ
jgi:hypothetical protein